MTSVVLFLFAGRRFRVLLAVVLCQLLSRVMRPVQGASWRLAGGTGWTQLHVQARKPRLLAPAAGASLGGVGWIAVLAVKVCFCRMCFEWRS